MVVKELIEARWKAIICGLLALVLGDRDYNTPELRKSCDPPEWDEGLTVELKVLRTSQKRVNFRS